ncbi:4-alpha-glucanotransferase [Oscillospiraceae bacterium LTW-04]|nr:4-alpha-glucanotransferase [Oscillospiraceae bacterium MB24-C1]
MKGRSSGVLLPVFSLPGDYGIGTLGKSAHEFIDFLAAAGQKVWQILPMVPPGSGNSPYMSPSAFAGNPLMLDLEDLAEQGLLTPEDLAAARFSDPDHVDYIWLCENRYPLLKKAWSRDSNTAARSTFLEQQASWLPDHAFFCALSQHFGCPLNRWPDKAARLRDPETLAQYRIRLYDEIDFQVFLQYHFFRQWGALRHYAQARNITIMGDIAIYVSADSAQVWSEPALFQVDENFTPTHVAGVPPDTFSDKGQHWGNPLYDWENQRDALFQWWAGRIKNAALLYDMVRIDHFRGFHTYWSIPAQAHSTLEGHWEKGPGQPLIDFLSQQFPDLALIAEDLGDLDEAARNFISQSGLPGMKVLVYAFDPAENSAYLPHNCPVDSVIYTGTHDTPTFVQWLFAEANSEAQAFALDYLRLRSDEGFGWGAVCGAWMSPSRLAIAPLQDILGLGADARVNFPGTTGCQNWSWRVRSDALNPEVVERLKKITRTYRRG